MQRDKVQRLLGLAARAGGVAFGEGAAEDSVRSKRARLAVVAADASDNTKKRLGDKCAFYGVRLIELGDRYELGGCMGKDFAVAAAVTNADLAKEILKQYESRDGE